jgi:hypothetical protein
MATRAAPAALTATRGMPRSTRQRAGGGDCCHRGQCGRCGGRARVAGRADRPGPRRPAGTRRPRCWRRLASAHAHRLRRQRLRQRAAAGRPARRRHRPAGQAPGRGRTQRALHQGPVPDRPWRRHRRLPRPSAPPRSSTTSTRVTATTARPASAPRARAARWVASAPAPRLAAPSPSPPTRPSWRRLAPARPTPTGPPTTAQLDPRWNESWPTWSAVAMAAAAFGSAAWPRSPPTSTCWPPRSTWPGWACSACTGPRQMAGQQHEPTGVTTSGSRRTPRRPAHQQAACSTLHSWISVPFHTNHLGPV